MFAHIKGKLYSVEENFCVIDNSGIGYKIFCNQRDISHISSNYIEDIHFYTILIHREDSMELYGFLNKIDLSIFKLLLLVRGIGPKQAIKIIGEAKSDDIVNSIYNEDSAFLKQISGIGSKKADQIILELKERIKKRYNILISNNDNANKEKYIEAVSALESLGFTKKEVKIAMEKVMKESNIIDDTGEIIQKALKVISNM